MGTKNTLEYSPRIRPASISAALSWKCHGAQNISPVFATGALLSVLSINNFGSSKFIGDELGCCVNLCGFALEKTARSACIFVYARVRLFSDCFAVDCRSCQVAGKRYALRTSERDGVGTGE